MSAGMKRKEQGDGVVEDCPAQCVISMARRRPGFARDVHAMQCPRVTRGVLLEEQSNGGAGEMSVWRLGVPAENSTPSGQVIGVDRAV